MVQTDDPRQVFGCQIAKFGCPALNFLLHWQPGRHNFGCYNSMRSYVESSYHKLVLKSKECQELKKEKKQQLFKVVR